MKENLVKMEGPALLCTHTVTTTANVSMDIAEETVIVSSVPLTFLYNFLESGLERVGRLAHNSLRAQLLQPRACLKHEMVKRRNGETAK